jgi:hypothetical protein
MVSLSGFAFCFAYVFLPLIRIYFCVLIQDLIYQGGPLFSGGCHVFNVCTRDRLTCLEGWEPMNAEDEKESENQGA